jgi:hypothetical protein
MLEIIVIQKYLFILVIIGEVLKINIVGNMKKRETTILKDH